MPAEEATRNAMHGFAVIIPQASSLGLGSKMCSEHFTLNNTYRFLIIFFCKH